MPDLRIITWNSKGESQQKATELQNEINAINALYAATPVDLILIQEAKNAANGDIYTALTPPAPAHITEMPNGQRAGYIAKVCHPATTVVSRPLQLLDYDTDSEFGDWKKKAIPRTLRLINTQAKNMRPPASFDFTHQGASIRLITWHAPLERPLVMEGYTMAGGACLDAFLFLDNSSLIEDTSSFDLVVIAGDLNAKSDALKEDYGGYVPLDDFEGESNHLDHIIAYRPKGGQITFHEARATASSSDHKIFSCRIHW
jgi:hypothetical protein